jgi:hypothetical protein
VVLATLSIVFAAKSEYHKKLELEAKIRAKKAEALVEGQTIKDPEEISIKLEKIKNLNLSLEQIEKLKLTPDQLLKLDLNHEQLSELISKTVTSSNPDQLLTQAEAVSLVNRWLQAKKRIYAPPYDRQLADELTTAKFYQQLTGSGGTIDWLDANEAYYRYGKQKIESVEQYIVLGNQATIDLTLTEERTLFIKGKIDTSDTDRETLKLRYNLNFINGKWKIANLNRISKPGGAR